MKFINNLLWFLAGGIITALLCNALWPKLKPTDEYTVTFYPNDVITVPAHVDVSEYPDWEPLMLDYEHDIAFYLSKEEFPVSEEDIVQFTSDATGHVVAQDIYGFDVALDDGYMYRGFSGTVVSRVDTGEGVGYVSQILPNGNVRCIYK